jgi:hypothetical protein
MTVAIPAWIVASSAKRLSPAVKSREDAPWRAVAARELPLMLFCKSKSPAH